jgi:TRAP-type C4-dicarboxylate transport system substrate-binding protein
MAALRSTVQWRGQLIHALGPDSHLQSFLQQFSEAVRAETADKVDITVVPDNAGIKGFEPLEMLVHRFLKGLFENGFRHISTYDKPIQSVRDLAGLRIRVPHARMIEEVLKTFGAVPVALGIEGLPRSLRERRVDGHENPFLSFESHRSYELTRYISLTSHMWTGFNFLASMKFWNQLPSDIQRVVDRNVTKYAARQRVWAQARNATLETELPSKGAIINTVDSETFKRALEANFYRRWRAELGATAWDLLEAEVGRLPG